MQQNHINAQETTFSESSQNTNEQYEFEGNKDVSTNKEVLAEEAEDYEEKDIEHRKKDSGVVCLVINSYKKGAISL
ncbi:hypothetical protein [Staphylococcus saprophyticus]|uniref:hypothetical protein n=1 Tax=Staphylococcus saprophyticus TaxID=29385 RepID=UPI000E04740E|nr:hypothetical protein [Staphylococcus saprophyticus]SUN42093.1 Uncharacterised protein [Staphylococcus saprophyticus]